MCIIACRSLGLSERGSRWYAGADCDPMHGPPNGRGQKGPDAEAIPGCRPHHDEQTAIGWPAFEQKYGFSRSEEAAKWWAAFQDGTS